MPAHIARRQAICGPLPNASHHRAGATAPTGVAKAQLRRVRCMRLFGGAFKLHSVTADLWVSLGLLGLLLAAVVAVLLVGSLARSLAERDANMLVTFTTVVSIWFLLFGPIVSNLGFVVDDLRAIVDRLRADGYSLIGAVGEYEGIWRMAHIRGPEGIIVSLSERIG